MDMRGRIVTTSRSASVKDSFTLYFEGASHEDTCRDAIEAFLACYNSGIYVCSQCGDIVYPTVTTDEHGIFISDSRSEIRGGLANKLLKKNVCGKCAESIIKNQKPSLSNCALCDSCVHSEVCRFEVPPNETCEYYSAC